MGGKPVDLRKLLKDITARALEDPQFRQELTAAPKETIEAAMGVKLPGDLWIEIIQQEPNSLYLVLPPSQESNEESPGSELDEATFGDGPAPEPVACGGTVYLYENGQWVAQIESEDE